MSVVVGEDGRARCGWVSGGNAAMVAYHDQEWGVPVHDDQTLFEFLILEGAQAGLSWSTVLNKRPRYREQFANFDPVAVAKMTEKDQERLLKDPGLIRNRLKIKSAIGNAICFLSVAESFGSFDAYLWEFVDGQPISNRYTRMAKVPATSKVSDVLSADLKKRGFKFVGSTIIYAYMQAVGMVDDHLEGCFCRTKNTA